MTNTKDPTLKIMKNKFKPFTTLFLLTAFFSFQSCDEMIDEIHKNKAEQNYVSPYRGKYTGTYTGDSAGDLIINVSEKGSIEITRTSLNSNESYYTGLINASFNTTNKAASGFMLIGNLNSKMGTWEMGTSKGNWTVKKN